MSTIALNPKLTRSGVHRRDRISRMDKYIESGASLSTLTWSVLGGSRVMPKKPVSVIDLIALSRKGISKSALMDLAEVLGVPMKGMAGLLNISDKTLSRKKPADRLDTLSSSMTIEIASTVARGLSVFENREMLNRWLQNENRALKGEKPFNLLNTPTGIRMVNRLLGRIEEGIYT